MLHTKAIIFLLGRNLFMLDKGKHFLLLTVSTLIMAIGTYFFKFTNNFTFGGITGLAVLIAKTGLMTAGMDFLLLRSQLADAESSCGSDSIA